MDLVFLDNWYGVMLLSLTKFPPVIFPLPDVKVDCI
jgi:hypothetical protein